MSNNTFQVSDTPTWPEVIRAALDVRLQDMHTCIPGVIVSYDNDTQFAAVQPTVKAVRRIEGQQVVEAWPVINNVPIVHYGSGDYGITVPVTAGDGVVLVFAEQSIDKLLVSNGDKPLDPRDPRRFNHNDAIGLLGFRSSRNAIDDVPTDAMVLRVPAGKQVRLGGADSDEKLAYLSSLGSLKTLIGELTGLGGDGTAIQGVFAAWSPRGTTKTRGD
jgi:Phage protein Gp138 N-terminal domain